MWRLLTDLIDKARPAVEASNCGEVGRWRGGEVETVPRSCVMLTKWKQETRLFSFLIFELIWIDLTKWKVKKSDVQKDRVLQLVRGHFNWSGKTINSNQFHFIWLGFFFFSLFPNNLYSLKRPQWYEENILSLRDRHMMTGDEQTECRQSSSPEWLDNIYATIPVAVDQQKWTASAERCS